MEGWHGLAAAVLLSLERLFYVWVWRAPGAFRDACAGVPLPQMVDPGDTLRFFFCGFKLLQSAVFVGWCYLYGRGLLWPSAPGVFLVLGCVLLTFGQTLNLGVFYRLGAVGVFYGNRFGYDIRWCREFPFSLCDHPQYVGAVLSIWGFFLIMRFPHSDWSVIPLLETVYYALGAYWER